MDKLGVFFSKTGSILRDIFLYFIPAIPFVIILLPILKSLNLIDLVTFNKEIELFYQPIIKEVTFIVTIYLVGRLLNALSYPVFHILDSTVKKIGLKWPKALEDNWLISCENAEKMVKETNEYILYAYALKLKLNLELFLERNMYIAMSEKGLSTGFFIIAVLIPFVEDKTINILYKVIYSLFSLIVSILFYYMYHGSMSEYFYAFQAIEFITENEKSKN